MRITEKDLEVLYWQAMQDVLDVLRAEGVKGQAKFLKLQEIVRVALPLGSLCLGADAAAQLELIQGRAPKLYAALLELVQGGDALARDKFDKLQREEESLRQERIRLEQAAILLKARQAETAHTEAQLERERSYLQLERERVANILAALPANASTPRTSPEEGVPGLEEHTIALTDPDA